MRMGYLAGCRITGMDDWFAMPTPPKWTWATLRFYALAYLGTKRLPPGTRPILHAYLGHTAYPRTLYQSLKPYLRRPLVL